MKMLVAKLEESFARLVRESECAPIVEHLLDEFGFRKDRTSKSIVATDTVVSSEYIWRELELARADTRIVHLELEDLIQRRTDREVLLQAASNLLSEGGKVWQDIRFIDIIHVADRTMEEQ